MDNIKINVDQLIDQLLRAGNLIRQAQRSMLWDDTYRSGEILKSDQTPRTDLDQLINNNFSNVARRNNIGFVGEEGNGAVDKRVMLFVDPIDGTGAFTRGMNTASVIATVMAMDGNEGTPLFSIIYEPLRDAMWIGQKDKPTMLLSSTGQKMRLPMLQLLAPQPWKTNICVFPGAGYRLAAVKARIESDPRFSQQDMGAFGISGGLIASGIIHAAAIAPTSAVESAAMSLIVKGVGGVTVDLNNRYLISFALGTDRKGKVDFLLPHGALFASNVEIAETIIATITAEQDGV